MLRSLTLCSLLLTTAACTQAPAQVDLRGQNTYGQNAVASNMQNNAAVYAAYKPAAGGAPISMQTQSAAATPSIGVSDLTPPSSSTPAANKAVTPFKTSSAADTGSVNQWTKTPRDSAASTALDESFNLSPKGKPVKEQMVSEVKPVIVQKKPVVLDTIVSKADDTAVQKSTVSPKKAEAVASTGFMWPVGGKQILSQFGPKGNGKVNDGINIASTEGEPVWAAADGEVVYVGNELQGYGNIVLIKHSGNKTTTYAHLSRYTVDKYDRIKQGDIIGYVGNTGNVKEPQLHFAVRDGKDAVDPLKYLNRDVASR